jgi:hypothetical protein
MSDELRKAARELLESLDTYRMALPNGITGIEPVRAALSTPEISCQGILDDSMPESREPTQEQAFSAWAARFGLTPEDQGAGIANIAHANGHAAGYAAGYEAGRMAGGKDGERLDFMIEHDAAHVHVEPAKPPYEKMYQVWEQDEDEGWHIISGEGRFFKSQREAIDAAIAKEPKS